MSGPVAQLAQALRFGTHGQSEPRYVGELLQDVVDSTAPEDQLDLALAALDELIAAARCAKTQVSKLKRSY